MHPTGAEAELSVTRSRLRRNALIMLSSLGEAYPSQLARACGIDSTRLLWAMRGRPPKYREDLSLVALGLAREVTTMQGRKYEITSRGRRKARSLTSRTVRRAERARSKRPAAGVGAPEDG